MKKITIIFLIAISSTISFANSKKGTISIRPRNNINLGLVGNGSLISVNYERLFIINKKLFLAGQLGLGYNEEFDISSNPTESYLTISQRITGNTGKGKHCFEYGIGGTIINGNTDVYYLLYPIIGYRIQPLQSRKFVFRIFASIPFTGLDTDDIMFIPFGLSLGINF